MRLYGLLEIAAGGLALALPLVAEGLARLSPSGGLAVAALLVAAPAAAMGATLPVLVAASGGEAGRATALLYGANTLGAVSGATLAGFVLLERIGTRATGLAGAAALGIAGAIALGLARRFPRPNAKTPPERAAAPAGTDASFPWVAAALFASGFAALAGEVVWTRALAQFFENSVYSFAAVLALLLLGIACGSLAARVVLGRTSRPLVWLGALQAIEAAAVLGGILLLAIRDYPGAHERLHVAGLAGFGSRLAAEALFALPIVFLPAFLSGTALPLGVASIAARSGAARVCGRLYAANTVGAVLGSLAAGFVLLPALGIRGSLLAAALSSAAAAALVARRAPAVLAAAAGAAALALPIGLVGPSLRFWRARVEETTLVAYAEDEIASVSIVADRQGRRRLKVNGTYSLGGDEGLFQERRQGILPLALHPRARSLLWIGLGTGHSLGAASLFPLERIVAAEIVPSVARLAGHFERTSLGVLEDPRVELRVGDGRAFLRRSERPFDAIVADLLLPWEAGAGFLYTREFYEEARAALVPGGQFAQWLPLHQMRPLEWGAVVRTVIEVFADASLWIAYPQGIAPIVAVVAWNGPAPDLAESMRAGLARADLSRAGEPGVLDLGDALALLVSAGEPLRAAVSGFPIGTDDRCPIEFLAPRSGPERPRLPLVNLAVLRAMRAATPPPPGFEGPWNAGDRILAGHEIFLRSFLERRPPSPEEDEAELREYAAALAQAPLSPYANAVCVARLTDALAAERIPAARLVEIGESMWEAGRNNFGLAYHLGLARARAGEWFGAEVAFDEAVRLQPRNLLARVQLGYARFERAGGGDAAEVLEPLLVEPDLPPFHAAKIRALLALARGDRASARVEFEQALRLRPPDEQLVRWMRER